MNRAAVPALFFSIGFLACGGSGAGAPPPGDAGSPTPGDASRHDAAKPGEKDAPAETSKDAPPDMASGPCVSLGASLTKALDAALPGSGSPGAVLAVKTASCRIVLAAGTSTKSSPMSPDDVLRVGSVTKTFVSAAVLRLVNMGKLALDDTLDAWSPEFPNASAITVTELLNHTSGAFDYTQDSTWQSTIQTHPGTVWTPQQLVSIAAGHPPAFAPGASWGYSNTDYILLGIILEKVTGKNAGQVLHEQAIDLAGLEWTSFPGYEPIRGALAHGYATTGADVSTLYDPSYAWTAGAVVASAGDLADWAVALYGGSILPAASLSLMLTPVPTGTAGEEYGLGVFILEPSITGGGVAWGHPGDINGYHTQMFYFPGAKTAVVGMVNSDAGDPNAISLAALDVLGL